MRAIHRKLWRELGRLKGQVATIALVLAAGMMCFIALRGTCASLDWSREAYYDRYRFAHLFGRVERAPESVAHKIEVLPGVLAIQTRISEEVALPMEGMSRPAYARLLSLPSEGDPATNALYTSSGRLPKRERNDEVALLASFAEAHGLHPGDHVPAIINGKLRKLVVVGTVLSPEFVYAIRPGAMVDDPQRYAVLWMTRTALASAFQLDGAFNDITVRLKPDASVAATQVAMDRILRPYGSNGTVDRAHQTSNRILTGELSQLEMLAGMVPIVFLGVAAFLINMVLGRLISLQRSDIAALKALGYSNREVGMHYLGLVLVVMLPGSALGIIGGYSLGQWLLGVYGALFRFPDLDLRLDFTLIASAVTISSLAAATGAFFAVRSAVKLPPAEAMRPAAPSRYRRSFVERLGLGRLFGPSGMMVLREIERRPLRTATSVVGIGGAIALIVLGHFGTDSLDAYLDGTMRREQRHDLAVIFAKSISPRAIGELGRLPGVRAAEGIRAVPVRARHDQRMRDSVLLGIPERANLRHLIAKNGDDVALPKDGVVVTRTLGEILGIQVGDRIDLETLEGDRRMVRPVVVAFVDESVGMQIYAQADLVNALESDLGAVSSGLLEVDRENIAAVEARLRLSPYVIDVSDLDADTQRLRDMNGSIMDIWTFISVSLSGLVIFGVVYNNARIALAMRSRELASLRVLGMSRAEISSILIGSLAIELALAIPVGLVLGRIWAELFMGSVDEETFRWTVVISLRTYVLSAAVALLTGAASALWVRRSLDRLDLIGVLKTRE